MKTRNFLPSHSARVGCRVGRIGCRVGCLVGWNLDPQGGVVPEPHWGHTPSLTIGTRSRARHEDKGFSPLPFGSGRVSGRDGSGVGSSVWSSRVLIPKGGVCP